MESNFITIKINVYTRLLQKDGKDRVKVVIMLHLQAESLHD